MSAVINGLLGGAIATLLVAAARRTQRSARLQADGWHTLRPGWLLYGAFGLSLALSLFIGWILLNGGSTRPDAETQNLYASGLAIAFGCGAIYMAWVNFGRTIAWRDTEIRISTLFRKDAYVRFEDIQSIAPNEANDDFRITLREGSKLVLSPYFHGATELADQVGSFVESPKSPPRHPLR